MFKTNTHHFTINKLYITERSVKQLSPVKVTVLNLLSRKRKSEKLMPLKLQ